MNKRRGLQEEQVNGIILDAPYPEISARDGDRNETIPMVQAVVRSMAVNAAKEQHPSQRLFAEFRAAVESSGNPFMMSISRAL